jgi:hypothetical protein
MKVQKNKKEKGKKKKKGVLKDEEKNRQRKNVCEKRRDKIGMKNNEKKI